MRLDTSSFSSVTAETLFGPLGFGVGDVASWHQCTRALAHVEVLRNSVAMCVLCHFDMRLRTAFDFFVFFRDRRDGERCLFAVYSLSVSRIFR